MCANGLPLFSSSSPPPRRERKREREAVEKQFSSGGQYGEKREGMQRRDFWAGGRGRYKLGQFQACVMTPLFSPFLLSREINNLGGRERRAEWSILAGTAAAHSLLSFPALICGYKKLLLGGVEEKTALLLFLLVPSLLIAECSNGRLSSLSLFFLPPLISPQRGISSLPPPFPHGTIIGASCQWSSSSASLNEGVWTQKQWERRGRRRKGRGGEGASSFFVARRGMGGSRERS